MKRFRLVLSFLLGALVVAGAAQADGSSDDEGKCRAVRARGVGQDLGNGTTTATITNGGILNGTTAATFGITGGAPPVLTFAGTVVFTTKRGTLTVGIAGTFNVATGAFDASGPINGGTGRFAGASGMLRLVGVQDSTGRFTETVRGTLCLADDDDDDDD